MQAIAATVAGSVGEVQTKPIAGLVYAVRFHGDGTPEELNVDGPIATARAGFGCISIWLTRAPATFWMRPRLSPSTRGLCSSLPMSINSCTGAMSASTAFLPTLCVG
jgi:hypothetical protein